MILHCGGVALWWGLDLNCYAIPSCLCQVIDQLGLLSAARGGWASEVNLLKDLRLRARVLTEGIVKVSQSRDGYLA